MSRCVGHAESHTCSTGADVSAAFSVLKLRCLVLPHVKRAWGLHRVVRRGVRVENCVTGRNLQ